jgi:hypothetical protein
MVYVKETSPIVTKANPNRPEPMQGTIQGKPSAVEAPNRIIDAGRRKIAGKATHNLISGSKTPLFRRESLTAK